MVRNSASEPGSVSPARHALARAFDTVLDIIDDTNRMRREAASRYPFLQI
ncbi:hypothetical protein [Rhodoplanes roseus]|nr:hypothetical protein [Rhodoplanes roseus]